MDEEHGCGWIFGRGDSGRRRAAHGQLLEQQRDFFLQRRLLGVGLCRKCGHASTASAARAHRHCMEYSTGNYHLPDRGVAAALFVDTLLAHLAAEDAWLAREDEHQKERLKTHD